MAKTINKEILRLAVPNILSNISVPLLSTVDTILMGDLSSRHLAAIGLGSMLFSFFYWNFGFLRMGTTGIVAQAYGRRDRPSIALGLYRGLILALFISICLLIFQQFMLSIGSYALNVLDTHQSLVDNYFNVRIWAAPATLSLFVLMGWFFGMQNAYIPLALTIISNIVNIGLSIYFVQILNMGEKGVALGTVIAQYVGCIAALLFIATRYAEQFKVDVKSQLKHIQAFKKFLRFNFDIFLRTVCLTLSFTFFYNRSSHAGELVLAINVVLMQFVNWMSYGIDGFAYASESLVGKYKGMNNEKKLKESIHLSFFWGMGVAAAFSILYGLQGQWLFSLFTDDQTLFPKAKDLMIYIILFPILASPSYIWDGIYIGLTAARSMRNAMFLALAVFIGGYYSIYALEDGHQIWMAMLLFMVSRSIFQYILYHRHGFNLT